MSEEQGFDEPTRPSNTSKLDDVAKMRQISRRSFVQAGVAVAAAYGVLKWINTRPAIDGVQQPLRQALLFNQGLWSALYSSDRLVPTYDASRVTAERVNGLYGLTKDFDVSKWTLKVVGVHGKNKPVVLKMADILKLPSMVMTTEFFCIEGWSIIQTFKGIPLREFMKLYPPDTLSGGAPDLEKRPHDLLPYVGIETPDSDTDDQTDDSSQDETNDSNTDDSSSDSGTTSDSDDASNDAASDSSATADDDDDEDTKQERATKYSVGLDVAAALHAQTMLCYELNGKPLTLDHGAPLRLIIPTKYGVKNIKRIGTITYTKARPRDYWAENGYDWYAGL